MQAGSSCLLAKVSISTTSSPTQGLCSTDCKLAADTSQAGEAGLHLATWQLRTNHPDNQRCNHTASIATICMIQPHLVAQKSPASWKLSACLHLAHPNSWPEVQPAITVAVKTCEFVATCTPPSRYQASLLTCTQPGTRWRLFWGPPQAAS